MNERETKIKILETLLDNICEVTPKREQPPFPAILYITDFQDWGVDADYIEYVLKKLREDSQISGFQEVERDIPYYQPSTFMVDIWPEGVKETIAKLKDMDDSEYPTKIYFAFNEDKSELKINDKKIKITEKNDKTIGHYILSYIFEKGVKEISDFSEIAEAKYKGEEYKWYKYHNACMRLQEKIRKITGIEDFLKFSSGRTGSIQINPRYL